MVDRRHLTLDDVAAALDFIRDYDDRDTWLQMGMAIKAEFGENGFEVWDKWSERADSYKAKDARAVWKSFKKRGIGIGSLIKQAQDNGFTWSASELSDDEKRRREAEAEKRKEENKKRRAAEAQAEKERHETAAKRAADIWPGLPQDGYSPYLARKQIHGFGCRYGKNNSIVVPLRKSNTLTGLQFIQADGDKKFLTGTEKSGASFIIRKDATGATVLCTGYATCCSIAMALPDVRVVVCFDDGNLVTVAEQYADSDGEIIIAADNDHGKPVNSGLKHARQIVDKHGWRAVWPEGIDGSDFNDLHVEKGLDAVAAVFNGKEQREFPTMGGEVSAPNSVQSVTGSPDEPPGQKSRGSSPHLGGNGGFCFTLESMLENYAHIYGKSPQIFDKRARKIISPATLHEIAEGAYKEWKKSPNRHIVDEDNVVFDPSLSHNPETSVNLFGGFPLKPKQGQCDLIIALLYYLVNENDQALDWLLKWIALPLQKPGAKMRTAVVMHGTEGAGKNLFWSVIERIYGEYSTIITQNEIESQFNGWASKKLFVIGNEVVSRQEMYHKKGIIKNMITEPEWLINDKNMPLRKEANHANFVFFSNVMQPVTPDTGDRRFMVIWTPKKQAPDYYQSVVDQINSGGVEAFYNYLIQLDLDDFHEFTDPLLTTAKSNLIDLSMRSDERFIVRWKASELGVPFQLCRTVDLYAAYQHWTRVEGEKFSVSKTEFLMRLAHDDDTEKHTGLRYLDGSVSKRTSFIGPAGALAKCPVDASKEKYVGTQSDGFNAAFREWKGGNNWQEASAIA